MKLPAFQFYPGDWRKDAGVQSLSYHDRGVWFEILCLMHESEQRGKLLLGGQPMPESALARLLGLDKQNLSNTLTTLLNFGVATREPETGALVCRRMVRDEKIREIRRNAGKMGGNPDLLKQNRSKTRANAQAKREQTPKQNPTPSSSSSISSSDDEEHRHRPPSFAEVMAFAKSAPMPIPQECAEAFFDEMETLQWTYRGQACVVTSAWHARFRRFSTNWNNNERGRQ